MAPEHPAAKHPDAALAEAADRGHLPSVAAACFAGPRRLWTGANGSHATIAGADADADLQYRIGSITKTLTAVAVMRLRDAGQLALSDPVSRFVADAPFGGHTLHALLAHHSGMPSEPVGPWWERNTGVDRATLWQRNAGRTDLFAAGERYHYSNVAFALLGAVVEDISGLDWMAHLQAQLLGPLGMTSTTYAPGPHAAEGTSWTPDGRLMAEPSEETGAMAPAGQLWSTVADLARWGAFLAVGHPEVLSPASLVEMQTVQSGDPDTQHEGAYGLGHRLTWAPSGTLVGHSGSMPGFLADLLVNARTGVGAVVLTNATVMARPHDTARQLLTWAEQQAAPGSGPEVTPWGAQPLLARIPDGPAPSIDELLGRWYWGNTPFELTATEHGFCLRQQQETSWHFRAVDGDTYLGLTGYHAGETLHVVRADDGVVSHLEVATFVLTRVPHDRTPPILDS